MLWTFSFNQIRALLKKDLLIRLRQPWMTIVQFVWPCLIFISLYALRHRFQAENIPDCQFPTRQLPTHNNLIPFFHSYICTIENKCQDTKNYEEYSRFEDAPLKPILNIIEVFLNDDPLYKALTELPKEGNWISAVTTIATHPKFKLIQENIGKIIASIPAVEKMIAGRFDITKMFSDDTTFAKSGKIICGHPFPVNHNIRFVNNILDSEDFSDVNQDELDAMPTEYCKKLYTDITRSNRGKITWSQVKPIIQGKIIYGPDQSEIASIIKFANGTFEEMNRLKTIAFSLDKIIVKLHIDKKFLASYMQLIDLAKSPIVKAIVGDSVDIPQIESVMNHIKSDPDIADIIRTVHNILECFSVDRFVQVKSENDLTKTAFDLNQKRLFYGGIYFNETSGDQITYKMYVETDNTPVTIETKNRFWFPGPEASMVENMRYHRGFVQIKQSVDTGIIKYTKSKQFKKEQKSTTPAPTHTDDDDDEDWLADFNDNDGNSTDDELTGSTINRTASTTTEAASAIDFKSLIGLLNSASNPNKSLSEFENDWGEDFDHSTTAATAVTTVPSTTSHTPATTAKTQPTVATTATTTSTERSARKKRAPQLSGLFGSLFGSSQKTEKTDKFLVDDIQVHTKQFPYSAYIKDDFKRGLYLAQSIQMAFFMALLLQIASCVRYRIWMKESKNTMLMNSMGLKSSSEILAWILTTFIEILIVFIIACIILYAGEILYFTSFIFILTFLVLFGICMISFCYMCSTIFSSASIGSVSSSILFLISFLPYIIIICLDTQLPSYLKFITNLSFSTAFCYAFDYIMRQELQAIPMTYSAIFENGLNSEFAYATCMIVLDIFVYAIIGYCVNRIRNDEYKFHRVDRKDMDTNLGAQLLNVSKVYDGNKIAVGNINLEFPKNKITCLLGRNGAGKSTIIKMLTGQTIPSSGQIYLSQQLTSIHENDKIGFCSQDNILIPKLTAKEHLQLYARIKIKKNFDKEVEKTMKSLNLGKYENYEAYKLSGGYQRKLCVAIAFIGSPNVVILDEPCSSIDTNSRRHVWELVEQLRQGRAVILATHFLEEAEYFSDSVVILNEGKIVSQYNPQTLEKLFTKSFNISVQLKQLTKLEILEKLKKLSEQFLKEYQISCSDNIVKISVDYDPLSNDSPAFFEQLELLQSENQIEFAVTSQTLENIFVNLDNNRLNMDSNYEKLNLHKKDEDRSKFKFHIIRYLLWKRFLHLRRNYKLLLCILGLPLIFQIIAMGFMQLRPGGEYDTELSLTRTLYPNTTEFYSLENSDKFTNITMNNLMNPYCESGDCHQCSDSEEAFYWILNTENLYHMKRYGGITINNTVANIWYNNKGYHSMVAWQNELNSNMFKTEMNNTNYTIRTINKPLKLGDHELSTSSILQQVSDAGISLILLIAFSLVAAGASVFIVNERVSGEKLQQKLCGVDFQTYWGVAFVWDFVIYLISLIMCVIVIQVFGIPIFVAKSNLNGICLLAVLYGFAAIAMVHLFEKLFAEASFANMTIFCMNVIIALATLTIIVLFDVIGESDESVAWRNIINRVFLIFPQHAFADGLIEICKNYITSEVFIRLDIDSYKSPISSTLLISHYSALICLGLVFMILNYIIENRKYIQMYEWSRDNLKKNPLKIMKPVELNIISIQNSLKHDSTTIDSYSRNYTLRVNNLKKSYNHKDYTVNGVSFMIRSGECYGLIGKNGAGKSTIFQILSGQIRSDSGTYEFSNNEIAYCPQSIALDQLLTVKEILQFYGNLRRIIDINMMIEKILRSFNLENYIDVMVKNLSGGNRRKLNVAVSCLGDCSIILMDEPTSDMDPVTRSLVYKIINCLLLDGKSVLLTSHAIAEIDKVCQQIGILKHGKLINCGSPNDLRQHFGGYYSVTLFHNNSTNSLTKQDIEKRFSYARCIQIHKYSAKFIVKIQSKNVIDQNMKMVENCIESTTLSLLFNQLNQFEIENKLKFSITRCRLEVMYEKIIDSNDDEWLANIEKHKLMLTTADENGYSVDGIDGRGYYHKSYESD